MIKPGQEVEQRWFIGAHADVGGATPNRRLSDITLKWMQERAIAADLLVDAAGIPQNVETNWMANPVNSYAEFLDGVYANTHQPFYRPIQLGIGLNDTIDSAVPKRCQAGFGYSPMNPGFSVPAPTVQTAQSQVSPCRQ